MAKAGLYGTDVLVGFQCMHGVGMAKRHGADALVDSGVRGGGAHDTFHRPHGQRFADTAASEDRRLRRALAAALRQQGPQAGGDGDLASGGWRIVNGRGLFTTKSTKTTKR